MIDAVAQLHNNIRSMKYVLIVVLFFAFALLSHPLSGVHAATPTPAAVPTITWKTATPQSYGSALDGSDMNAQSAWHTGIQYSMYSLSCLGSGIDCTGKEENTPANICGSAFGQINNIMASTFVNKPADTGLWLADTGRTLGFLPREAMAQGIGFSGMQPLLPIWKAFRNIAYLLMAVVMLVLGFMIMFRKKIDPHTVVTAQNAIPKVVVALILITFSYAIVGILIDFMYVLIYFIIALFKSTGLLDNPSFPTCLAYKTPEQLYGQGGLWANFFNIPKDPYRLLFGITNGSSAITAALSGAGLVGALMLGSLTGGPLVAGAVGVGLIVGLPILHLIITIIVIFLFLKLMFFFLGAYIQVIISLLLAPLQLLFEAVPGSNAFSSWISNLIANLAVFPVGAAMFMLSNVFTHFANQTTGTIWAPPYAPLSGNATQLSAIIALGVLFAIPQAAGAIKEALKAKPVVGGSGPGNGMANAATSLSMLYYAQSMTPQVIKDRISGMFGGSPSQPKH